MSLFKKPTIDTEKELELIATLFEFTIETTEEEVSNASYGPKEAKKSLNRKADILEDLLKFDLESYKDRVDKKLFSSAHSVKNALRDELYAWIQEDKLTLEEDFNAYKVEKLLSDARSAQYRLQSSLKSFRNEMSKTEKRYKAAHGGKDIDGEIEKYSVRNSL